jgi:hypothetical protein
MVNPVPPEFSGRPRALRERLRATDLRCSALVGRVLAPLIERKRRSPIPRPEMMAGVARAWRVDMPAFGRLDLHVQHSKRGLTIAEMRVGACKYHWRDP